jgi:WD40 repeat protein
MSSAVVKAMRADRSGRAIGVGVLVAAVAAVTLVSSGCSGDLPAAPQPPRSSIAWLSYADDGTLLAASRDHIARLDTGLNELDRTAPPFPFDPTATQPGLEYVRISRDGSVAAVAWQDNSDLERPATLNAGATIFDVPSAALVLDRSYAAGSNFQGLSLSPDGLTMAVLDDNLLQVSSVADGSPLWSAPEAYLLSPPFSGDGAALVTAASAKEVDVLRASDGAQLLAISPPGAGGWLSAAVSADGTTFAIHAMGDLAHPGTISLWRLSDGLFLGAATLPADVLGIPTAMALSPSADLLALSFVPSAVDTLLVWRGDQLLYRHDGESDFALAFSPDGATLATASAQSGVRLLGATDGRLLAERNLAIDSP